MTGAAPGLSVNGVAAWAAFAGVAAGLTGLLLYKGLREALSASRAANDTLRESLKDERDARETAETRHKEEVAECHTQISDLAARLEVLQTGWVTEIAAAVAKAVAAAGHEAEHRRRTARGGQ